MLSLYAITLISAFSREEAPLEENKSGQESAKATSVPKAVPDAAGQAYFPKGRDTVFYTRHLAAMKEPSVSTPLKKGVTRVYRFTCIRAYHDPLAVRIVQKGNTLTVRAIRLKLEKDHSLGKIVHDKTWELNDVNSKVVRPLLEQKDFWKPLTATEKTWNFNEFTDSLWLFEVHDKEGYRMIDIGMPDDLPTRDEFKENEIDPTQFRDFAGYLKTGNQLLETGKILPAPYDTGILDIPLAPAAPSKK